MIGIFRSGVAAFTTKICSPVVFNHSIWSLDPATCKNPFTSGTMSEVYFSGLSWSSCLNLSDLAMIVKEVFFHDFLHSSASACIMTYETAPNQMKMICIPHHTDKKSDDSISILESILFCNFSEKEYPLRIYLPFSLWSLQPKNSLC